MDASDVKGIRLGRETRLTIAVDSAWLFSSLLHTTFSSRAVYIGFLYMLSWMGLLFVSVTARHI